MAFTVAANSRGSKPEEDQLADFDAWPQDDGVTAQVSDDDDLIAVKAGIDVLRNRCIQTAAGKAVAVEDRSVYIAWERYFLG